MRQAAVQAEAAAGRDPDAECEIVVRRVIAAPRDRLFGAFTDPQRVACWWGPDGFTTRTLEMNVRPGGVWRHVVHGPDGAEYPNTIVYEEIIEPHGLSWAHGSLPGEPPDFHSVATFDPHPHGTEVTLRMIFPSRAARDHVVREYGARDGAEQTLARLARHIAAGDPPT